jgi:hypothetical protein
MTIDSSALPTSLPESIRLHERLMRSGATHTDGCPVCQSQAFKRQRLWLRTVRFLEFESRLMVLVLQAVKITIARFRCTTCLHQWTDYPDFRPSS